MKKANCLFIIFLAVFVVLASTNTVQAVEIVKSLPFNIPPAMAYDSYKGAVWVTTYYSYTNELGMPLIASTNTVSAISDVNYTVLANVTVGKNPSQIVYASALHEVYVSYQESGKRTDAISVISTISNEVVTTIDLNKNSSQGDRRIEFMVYDSGKGEIFVSIYEYSTRTGEVLVISEKTKQVVATIPLGSGPAPSYLIYDSGAGEIYVYRHSLPGEEPENFLSVISDETNSVVATMTLDTTFARGAYDSATGEIYLPAYNSSILVVSDKTHTVTHSIPLEHYATSVACDPVKRVLFAGTAYNTTYIISDRTKSVIETVPIRCVSMVYDTGKNLMIASGNGSLQFISDDSLPSVSPTPTVPEFLPWIILTLFIAATALTLLVYFKEHKH